MITDADETECGKISDNIMKELKKREPSESALKEMLEITFRSRLARITSSDFTSKEVVPQLLKEFPFLKYETMVRKTTSCGFIKLLKDWVS